MAQTQPGSTGERSEGKTTLYFAYGSNLSLHQMKTRCPGSTYYGFGILRGYRWIIYERGYANVVKIEGGKEEDGDDAGLAHAKAKEEGIAKPDFVEGMLFTLTKRDEARLDSAEGVPFVYSKILLDIELLSTADSAQTKVAGAGANADFVKALVYVDVKGTEEGVIREEYIHRMNKGIDDARVKGMSEWYIKNVLRKWIPEEVDDGKGRGEVKDPFALSDD